MYIYIYIHNTCIHIYIYIHTHTHIIACKVDVDTTRANLGYFGKWAIELAFATLESTLLHAKCSFETVSTVSNILLILPLVTPNLPTNIVDFRGFDSSVILI